MLIWEFRTLKLTPDRFFVLCDTKSWNGFQNLVFVKVRALSYPPFLSQELVLGEWREAERPAL